VKGALTLKKFEEEVQHYLARHDIARLNGYGRRKSSLSLFHGAPKSFKRAISKLISLKKSLAIPHTLAVKTLNNEVGGIHLKELVPAVKDRKGLIRYPVELRTLSSRVIIER